MALDHEEDEFDVDLEIDESVFGLGEQKLDELVEAFAQWLESEVSMGAPPNREWRSDEADVCVTQIAPRHYLMLTGNARASLKSSGLEAEAVEAGFR